MADDKKKTSRVRINPRDKTTEAKPTPPKSRVRINLTGKKK